jgi:anaerobic selenocysteine-containing dehydrogenase
MTDTLTSGTPVALEPAAQKVHYRTCPLCEATCGLEITMKGNEVQRIRGDQLDVFSKGFICPKGSTIKDLDADPNRVRTPLIKENGAFRKASWDEAFALIDERLGSIRREHGNDSIAIYVGNPNAHSLSGSMYAGDVLRAFRTKNLFSASTVDQMPKQVSAGLMFGTVLSIPVPDVDHTDYLLMLGANPYDSNGSLFTAPDLPGRLESMRARGGKLVVVDPRRSKTAEHADEHVPILPGSDAYWLFALLHVIFADGLVDLGSVADHVNGLDVVKEIAKEFSPESVEARCGISADATRRIARELALAPTAAVYGRIGTCTQEFGTIASWLVDVLNVVTGNLDRRGGAMFTTPVAGGPTTRGSASKGRGVTFGRWNSRVDGHREVYGEYPVTALPSEIETPGTGQVRAMIVVGGNPVSSNPDSNRVNGAIASLEFLVSVDIYVNETSRHADVILPSNRILTKSHYDMSLYQLATRNIANWSAAVVELDASIDERHEWETLLRLAAIGEGSGPCIDVVAADDAKALDLCRKAVPNDVDAANALYEAVSVRRGPDRLLDIALRTGPYGAPSGQFPDGVSLDVLAANPHGVDAGPLVSRMPEVLRTTSSRIELAPQALVDDVVRLRARFIDATDGGADDNTLLLVGRRHVRSNNSWMHNVRVLVKGKNRCTLHVNPTDAKRVGVVDGEQATLRSIAGEVVVRVEVTDAIMNGVVSLPHGWGQHDEGVQLDVARSIESANTNVVVPASIDILSGNAVLTGVRVSVHPK